MEKNTIDTPVNGVVKTTATKKHKSRESLPKAMLDRSKYSIWSILKQCVDKELYRFTIPIIWNEPLSFLQRIAENSKFANDLLNKASEQTDPVQRMKYVAAFLISSVSIHEARLSKPFNPLLGETYELSDCEYRVCCEQVSHHPPVTAFHAESLSNKWKYYGSVYPQMKLNLFNASVEAYPEGIQTIEFPQLGQVYTWYNVKVNAHNLIIGKLWFEYTGQTEIIDHKNNIKCVLDFKPYSWFTRLLNRVEGYILNASSQKVCLVSSQWNSHMYTCDDPSDSHFMSNTTHLLPENHKHKHKYQLIWKNPNNSSEVLTDCYNFSKFTCTLNEMTDDLKQEIAPTDCRYRPDIRALEEGQFDFAASEKHRLEEKQRDVERRTREGELEPYIPLWFKNGKHQYAKDDTWTFTNEYWKRDYSKSPNIF